jgi:hypothetical protein
MQVKSDLAIFMKQMELRIGRTCRFVWPSLCDAVLESGPSDKFYMRPFHFRLRGNYSRTNATDALHEMCMRF